jgi:hypothetical protein
MRVVEAVCRVGKLIRPGVMRSPAGDEQRARRRRRQRVEGACAAEANVHVDPHYQGNCQRPDRQVNAQSPHTVRPIVAEGWPLQG